MYVCMYVLVLGIEPRGILAWSYILIPFYLFFLFFAVPGIEPRGVLPPRYTPSPIFVLYFETGSHEVAEGLTK